MPRNSLWSRYLLLMQNIYWVRSRGLIYRNSAVIAQPLQEETQTAGRSLPRLRDSGVARSRVPPADTSGQSMEGKVELVWPCWEAGEIQEIMPEAGISLPELPVSRHRCWCIGGMEEALPKRNRKKRHFYKYFYISFSNLLPFWILKPPSWKLSYFFLKCQNSELSWKYQYLKAC